MSTHADKVIEEFSSQYYGKIFYFCLKKTGNHSEAEDLASDVALDVIATLRKGIIPERFSAYVWKIARNRWYKWTENRREYRSSFSGEDLDFIESQDLDVEDSYIKKEDIYFLRREMAFISKEYREILVSFYIDDKKVSQISKELSLPEGTVKTKLFKSRKILMEGMKMAREFGVKSYKPENVGFQASGTLPSGLPWSAVQRKLPKNILLEAHNNPSTVEELSIEIGIAAPYMEEEVKILIDSDLLKETDGKYITNFFIADKECQLEVYNAQRQGSKERSKIIDEIVTDSISGIRNLGLTNDTITDNELKWLFIPKVIDSVFGSKGEFDNTGVFNRPDGGNWGFTGFESHNLISERTFMGHDGNGMNPNMFWRYSYSGYNIGNQVKGIGYNEILMLTDMIKNNRDAKTLTQSEQNLWNNIDALIVHTDENGNFHLNIPIFNSDNRSKTSDIIKNHPKYKTLEDMILSLFEEVKAILTKYSNPVLHEQLNYYVSSFMFAIRMMAVNDEVESGMITVPENAEKSTIGMYINIG